jgi:SAM-dependent methyltransferase
MLLRLKRALRIRTRLRDAHRWGVRYRWGRLVLEDWWIDRRFGAYCGGSVANPFEAQGATRTESATYRTLGRLFQDPRVQVAPTDVLVDIGCGKGRVINHWLRSGLQNQIIGIELNPAVGQWARARLAPFENVRIVIGDAVKSLPAEGTVFFLYNPFGRDTMEAFARELLGRTNTRALRIVYLNARHLDVFDPETWDFLDLDSDSPDKAVLIRHAAARTGAASTGPPPHPAP